MKFVSIFVLSALAAGVLSPAVAQEVEADPVADYYWGKARQAARQFDPNVAGVEYQLTARTFRHSIMRNGRISATDTILQTLYYTNGQLDSAVLIGDQESDQDAPDLGYPAVFDMDLYPYLFPNDTGGVDLAIGFLTDSTQPHLPDGLAVIDRYRLDLRSLYLSYNHRADFRRFSRCFRFTMVDDYVFPDSVWEIATELGVFFTESYRQETGITDIRVRRAAESTEP